MIMLCINSAYLYKAHLYITRTIYFKFLSIYLPNRHKPTFYNNIPTYSMYV